MFTPYQPRPITFLGVDPVGGYRLKVYAITFGDAAFDRGRFAGGWELATAALPQPATTDRRPGVGFAVLHQGRTGDYLMLCWWDRENELPTRVFVRDDAGWRPATGDESFCVWDLRVIWHEREAYVTTVLAERMGGVAAYLVAGVDGEA